MKRGSFLVRITKSTISLSLCLCLCLLSLCSAESPFFASPPPTVLIERNWMIPEDEPVGTRVAQARSQDGPNSEPLEFSIEPSLFRDGSTLFRIDQRTGVVYLNQSLQGKNKSQYYLQIVASRGMLSSKTEIWVQVTASFNETKSSGNRKNGPPGFFPQFGGSKPIKPQYPPSLMPPPGAIIPPLPPQEIDEESQELSFGPNANPTTQGAPSTSPTTTTSTKPLYPPHLVNSNKNNPNETLFLSNDTKVNGPEYNHIANNSYPTDPLNSGKEIKPDNPKSSTNSNEAESNLLVITIIVPIIVVFGVIPITVGSVWLIRNRTKKKVTKRLTKEMRKESATTSQSISSTVMSSESQSTSPNALKHWIKQAQSNRYESWNPNYDLNVQPQMWEFPRHHLQIGGILGEGCFGQVWKCEALNIDKKEGTTTVAVKTLKESAGDRERTDLLSELEVMKMLEPHPHVVRLLGCCTEKDPLFVIMEFVELGKLQTYLRNSRQTHYYGNLHGDSSNLSSKDLTGFCYQIAKGMEYLAEKGIIHRDLAARNILISKELVCKVSDFGFARDVVANHVYERKSDGRLPVRWMAPEALYDNIFTTKTDIWSFGVLMWEIVTLGSTPYPGLGASEVMRKVRDGFRLEKPEHCRRELYNIMYYCWAHSPTDRPTFTDLVKFLSKLLFSETDYIELERFPEHDYYNTTIQSGSISGEKL